MIDVVPTIFLDDDNKGNENRDNWCWTDVTDDESHMIVTNVDHLDCGDDDGDNDEDVTDDNNNKRWPPWLQRLGGEGGTEQLLCRRQDKADVTHIVN